MAVRGGGGGGKEGGRIEVFAGHFFIFFVRFVLFCFVLFVCLIGGEEDRWMGCG